MGWLPSAPQLGVNPLRIADEAKKAGMTLVDYTVKSLKEGSIRFAAEQPEKRQNHPRNLFIWRSNLLVLPVKAMNTCSLTCWVPRTAFRAKTGNRAA